MKFISYQKIPTETSAYNLSKEDNYIFRLKWIVLEKVHGANFSVYCNGDNIKFAKRTAFLEDNEWFYNYQVISEVLSNRVKDLYHYLKSIHPDIKYIILYGELCGGFYPQDKDVSTWKGALSAGRINSKQECIIPQEDRAIQEGIYYSPNIEYIVLDMCIVNELDECKFVDYDQLMIYAKKFKLNYLEPLFTGSFVDSINFNYKFDSKVSTDVFLQKKLPSGTNVAEGVVIKPIQGEIMVKRGKDSVKIRPLVKLKHPSFMEISSDFSLPSVTTNMILLTMINMNRLNALVSKLGKIDRLKINEVVEMFVEDIWLDYYEKYPHIPVDNYDESNIFLYNKSKDIIDKYLA